jgi:hypothetical protein
MIIRLCHPPKADILHKTLLCRTPRVQTRFGATYCQYITIIYPAFQINVDIRSVMISLNKLSRERWAYGHRKVRKDVYDYYVRAYAEKLMAGTSCNATRFLLNRRHGNYSGRHRRTRACEASLIVSDLDGNVLEDGTPRRPNGVCTQRYTAEYRAHGQSSTLIRIRYGLCRCRKADS